MNNVTKMFLLVIKFVWASIISLILELPCFYLDLLLLWGSQYQLILDIFKKNQLCVSKVNLEIEKIETWKILSFSVNPQLSRESQCSMCPAIKPLILILKSRWNSSSVVFICRDSQRVCHMKENSNTES